MLCKKGLTLSQGQDYFRLNRLVAYLGEVGRQREAFCRDYLVFKRATIENMETELRRCVAGHGQTITCTRGCPNCCSVHVFATLQECECIVYYLYRREDVLRHFMSSYALWRQKINQIGKSYRRIERLQEKVMMGRATQEERNLYDKGLAAYANHNIRCPFLLADHTCSIYEVRPFVCAGAVCVSPPEWCSPFHPQHDLAVLWKADIKLEKEMPYFIRPKNNIAFGCLPELVYSILERGYALLSTVPGLEWLKEKVSHEPEVLATFKEAGMSLE